MSEDKLSREELIIWLKDFWSWYKTGMEKAGIADPLPNNAEDALEQIKSLLTPIPEDKLDEFKEKWVDKFDALSYNGLAIDVDLWNQMLKEYEQLRRG